MREIIFNSIKYALVMDHFFHNEGISFLTSGKELLEMGYMSHPAGHNIVPHYHIPVERRIHGTMEVIYVKLGLIEIDFYDEKNILVGTILLGQGDWVLLLKGGHGIRVIQDAVLIEVKNGPYVGIQDKVKF